MIYCRKVTFLEGTYTSNDVHSPGAGVTLYKPLIGKKRQAAVADLNFSKTESTWRRSDQREALRHAEDPGMAWGRSI